MLSTEDTSHPEMSPLNPLAPERLAQARELTDVPRARLVTRVRARRDGGFEIREAREDRLRRARRRGGGASAATDEGERAPPQAPPARARDLRRAPGGERSRRPLVEYRDAARLRRRSSRRGKPPPLPQDSRPRSAEKTAASFFGPWKSQMTSRAGGRSEGSGFVPRTGSARGGARDVAGRARPTPRVRRARRREDDRARGAHDARGSARPARGRANAGPSPGAISHNPLLSAGGGGPPATIVFGSNALPIAQKRVRRRSSPRARARARGRDDPERAFRALEGGDASEDAAAAPVRERRTSVRKRRAPVRRGDQF